MNIRKRTTLLIVAASTLLFHSMLWAVEGRFSGDWKYVEYLAGSSKPHSIFEIKIHEASNGTVTGFYCFITQNGNRIDCGTNGTENIF